MKRFNIKGSYRTFHFTILAENARVGDRNPMEVSLFRGKDFPNSLDWAEKKLTAQGAVILPESIIMVDCVGKSSLEFIHFWINLGIIEKSDVPAASVFPKEKECWSFGDAFEITTVVEHKACTISYSSWGEANWSRKQAYVHY